MSTGWKFGSYHNGSSDRFSVWFWYDTRYDNTQMVISKSFVFIVIRKYLLCLYDVRNVLEVFMNNTKR